MRCRFKTTLQKLVPHKELSISLKIYIALIIVLLNSIVSLFAAYYLRKSGFLAPVGIHFWTDIVWHVVWGLVGFQGL